VVKRRLVFSPRAQRDLEDLEKRDAIRILDDLDILEHPPWPPGKVKKLRGREYWEIKTGDFRTIFWPQRKDVVVLRAVNRRELSQAVDSINMKALREWLRTRDER
jgi:mRNA-degrading endonuclease RelE of RelBE toxin-antitoxin system